MAAQTTTAAVLRATGEPLALLDLALPALQPGQVLVDVAFAGLCGTQLLEIRGGKGPDKYLPHVLGHEGSGIVAACGTGVAKGKPGDHVVLSWIRGAGLDVPGTRYAGPAGPVNGGAVCTFMTRTVTCESRVFRVPDALPLREAALLGCAVPTGAGIVRNTARLQPGQTIAIFGAGGIGLSAIMAAALAGAALIVAIDVTAQKLARARDAGATATIDARTGDPLTAIHALTGGKGVDVAVEATGSPAVMETAHRSVREKGGLCVIAGNARHAETFRIDPYDLIKGRRIAGSWGGETDPDRDIPHYADLFLQDKFPFGKLATHCWPLAQINAAFDALAAGEVSRALIDMTP